MSSDRHEFLRSHIQVVAGGMPTTSKLYVVKCDDCKRELRETDSLHESAAGGLCNDCRAESAKAAARVAAATP